MDTIKKGYDKMCMLRKKITENYTFEDVIIRMIGETWYNANKEEIKAMTDEQFMEYFDKIIENN